MAVPSIGRAASPNPNKTRRGRLGCSAALTEKAATPTPVSTKNHEPFETMADVIRTSVAVVMPVTAIATRVTLPSGRLIQSWYAAVVIAYSVSANDECRLSRAGVSPDLFAHVVGVALLDERSHRFAEVIGDQIRRVPHRHVVESLIETATVVGLQDPLDTLRYERAVDRDA